MKHIHLLIVAIFLANCSAIIPLDFSSLNQNNVDSHINRFARSMGNKCFNEVSETRRERKQFCNCVQATIKNNMKNKLSLNQIKQTLQGAFEGVQPVPNNKIVFSSVKKSCSALLN